MVDILNLALPHFGLIFIGFAGKTTPGSSPRPSPCRSARFGSVITLTSVMWFIQSGRLAFP
jgi:hypothetical protein